jgi:hypothetical protein
VIAPLDPLDVSGVYDTRIAIKKSVARFAVKQASVNQTEELPALPYANLGSDRLFVFDEIIAAIGRHAPDAVVAAVEHPEADRDPVATFIPLPSTRMS